MAFENKKQLIVIFTILVIQLILIGLMIFFINAIISNQKSSSYKNHRLDLLSNNIIYYDEVLTMSARMAAFTGDSRWEDRYNKIVPKLDNAFVEAIRRVPEIKSNLKKTEIANLRLIEFEENAFELVRQDKLESAGKLLFSDEYNVHKKAYSKGVDQAIIRLENKKKLQQELIESESNYLFILVTALLLLFFINCFYLLYIFKSIGNKLNVLTYVDELTDLYNRRYFNNIIKKEINRCRRNGKIFLFGMIDIDYFKKYNDIYGHQKGDKALSDVAKMLKKSLKRADDLIFRLGGEEFAFISVINSPKEGSIIAERLNKAIIEAEIKHEGNPDHNSVLTVSIGLSFLSGDNYDEAEFLYPRADKALYVVKSKGRNEALYWHEDMANEAEYGAKGEN